MEQPSKGDGKSGGIFRRLLDKAADFALPAKTINSGGEEGGEGEWGVAMKILDNKEEFRKFQNCSTRDIAPSLAQTYPQNSKLIAAVIKNGFSPTGMLKGHRYYVFYETGSVLTGIYWQDGKVSQGLPPVTDKWDNESCHLVSVV